jgi:hypothetical protein
MTENIETLNNEVDEGQEGNVDLQDTEVGSGEEINSQTNEKPKQDRDTNEQFKAARLAAERDAKAIKQRQDAFAQKYGFHTFEEMEAYQAQQEAEQQRQAYLQQGVNPDLINQLVSNHPDVKMAKMQQINAQLDADFAELKKEFPESGLKTLADLAMLPTYGDICEKLRRGYTLTDAYASANRAELRQKTTAAAKQKTLNNINSKQHLNTEGDGAGETSDIHIPDDTMQMYLDMGMDKKAAMKYHKKLYG